MCLRHLMSGASQVALVIKNLPADAADVGDVEGLIPGSVGRAWQPTPVFLPGESHGQRSLAGYIGLQRVRHDWSDLARTHVRVLLLKQNAVTDLNIFATEQRYCSCLVFFINQTCARCLTGKSAREGYVTHTFFNTLEFIFSTGTASGDSSQVFKCICRPVVKEHGFEAPPVSRSHPGPCALKKRKKSEVAQSRPILCDPMDHSLPGSSVHGILDALRKTHRFWAVPLWRHSPQGRAGARFQPHLSLSPGILLQCGNS